MAKVKVKLIKEEVRKQILQSPEMQAIIKEKCEEISGRAGEGYENEVKVGQKRCYGTVRAGTYRAKADNARNNTLLGALK